MGIRRTYCAIQRDRHARLTAIMLQAATGYLGVDEPLRAQPGRTILVAHAATTVVGTVDCAVLPSLTRGAQPFMLGSCSFDATVAAARRPPLPRKPLVELTTSDKRRVGREGVAAGQRRLRRSMTKPR